MFAMAALVCVPIALEAGWLLMRADDPVAISDRALSHSFDRSVAVREIEAALAAYDADLANSFVGLAHDRDVALPQALEAQVAAAVERAGSPAAAARSFTHGLITGEPDGMVGLAGTVLGDLFVFGDIRDALREGGRYVSGQEADELLLGLACIGIAITAGTYASLGTAAPARIGMSAVKVARKTGRMGSGMANWIGRSVREAIDWSALKRAGGSIAQPVAAVRAARATVKAEKANGLVRLVGDVGRVQTRAGTQAALDGLRISEGPRDMARVAALAEKKGGRTRAILKSLGRGAIMLSVSAFNLSLWMFSAILSLFGFVSSMKAAVERATLRHLARKRARAHGHPVAMAVQRA
jgi:hypothetical protein